MAKNWWFKMEWERWLNDDSLSICSLETQGFWIKCLCLMYRADVAELTGSIDQLRRLLGCLPEELTRCCRELKETNTADVIFGNGNVTLVSRSRQRELKANELTRLRVAKSRLKQECNAFVTPLEIDIEKEKEKEEEKEREKSAPANFSPPRGSPVKRSLAKHPAIEALTAIVGEQPPPEAWPYLIAKLGDDPDIGKLTLIFHEWISKGNKRTNWDGISDWYIGKRKYGTDKQNYQDARAKRAVEKHNLIEQLRAKSDARREEENLSGRGDADSPRQLRG